MKKKSVNQESWFASKFFNLIIYLQVVKKLQEKYGPDLYTHANVAISGTHTHSGPAGFLQYILFQVSSLGSVQDTVEAFVGGITLVSLGSTKNAYFSNGRRDLKQNGAQKNETVVLKFVSCPFTLVGTVLLRLIALEPSG